MTNCDVLDLQNDIDKIQLWSVENAMKAQEVTTKGVYRLPRAIS